MFLVPVLFYGGLNGRKIWCFTSERRCFISYVADINVHIPLSTTNGTTGHTPLSTTNDTTGHTPLSTTNDTTGHTPLSTTNGTTGHILGFYI
jgi:hypothetical protein